MTTKQQVPQQSGALDDPKVMAIIVYQAAMARGDFAEGSKIFDPSVTYHVSGDNQLSGDYVGPQAVMGYFGRLMELTSGTYSISRMNWMVSDIGVALETVNHAERAGRSLQWNEVIIFQFENGKKKRIDLYSGNQIAVDAFFGAKTVS